MKNSKGDCPKDALSLFKSEVARANLTSVSSRSFFFRRIGNCPGFPKDMQKKALEILS
jgi:hypothetical protein